MQRRKSGFPAGSESASGVASIQRLEQRRSKARLGSCSACGGDLEKPRVRGGGGREAWFPAGSGRSEPEGSEERRRENAGTVPQIQHVFVLNEKSQHFFDIYRKFSIFKYS